MSVAVHESTPSEQEVCAWEILVKDLHEGDTSTTADEHRLAVLPENLSMSFFEFALDLFGKFRGIEAISALPNGDLNLGVEVIWLR